MDDALSDTTSNRRRFDAAVARFNRCDYFEAHEDWEALWHEAMGAERLWLQGLIQVAAAFVHFERGFFARGFAGLMADGSAKLANYEGPTWNLDLEALAVTLQPWIEHAGKVAGGAALEEGAPPVRPKLAFRPPYQPSPLPPAPPHGTSRHTP